MSEDVANPFRSLAWRCLSVLVVVIPVGAAAQAPIVQPDAPASNRG